VPNLRLIVTFENCQGDYYELAMKARPFSPYLQLIEFIEPEVYEIVDPDPCIDECRIIPSLTVLAPPVMVREWANEPDVKMEHLGEQIVFMEIMRVCEREGILTQEELYG
jgi:hypothetical protein